MQNLLVTRKWEDPERCIKGEATFSKDENYRYRLVREWGTTPPLCFIMLNPSTADEQFLDPTVARCVRFAQRERAGSLIVLNIFAYRSTDPIALYSVPDPIGEFNNFAFSQLQRNARIVVAWGVHAAARRDRVKDVLKLLDGRELLCLGTTKHGEPKHPLYLKKDTALVPWRLR